MKERNEGEIRKLALSCLRIGNQTVKKLIFNLDGANPSSDCVMPLIGHGQCITLLNFIQSFTSFNINKYL